MKSLDDGTGTDRTILSGIHAYYEPEELIGKTLIAITNQKGGVGKTTTTVSLGFRDPDNLPYTLTTVLKNVIDDTLIYKEAAFIPGESPPLAGTPIVFT